MTPDGIVHDSKREADRWCYLKMLATAGEIFELQRQVPYELIPTQREKTKRYGKRGQRLADADRLVERPCIYIADFVYKDKDGNMVVEDAKGVRTEAYIIKRKLMLHVHKIRVREV